MEVPASMPSTFTTTRAPNFNVEGDFAEYERDFRLWFIITDIAEVKKGAAVLGGLSGSAKDFCATLSLENVLLQVNGMETVLNHMRNGYAASSEMQLQSDFASFLVLCAAKDETSVDTMRRMFCCNFLRKSRL
jgi:hypothetical protein